MVNDLLLIERPCDSQIANVFLLDIVKQVQETSEDASCCPVTSWMVNLNRAVRLNLQYSYRGYHVYKS